MSQRELAYNLKKKSQQALNCRADESVPCHGGMAYGPVRLSAYHRAGMTKQKPALAFGD